MLMVSVLVCLIAIPSHRHQNAARTVAAVHAEHAQQVKHVLQANVFVLKGRDVPVKRAGLTHAAMPRGVIQINRPRPVPADNLVTRGSAARRIVLVKPILTEPSAAVTDVEAIAVNARRDKSVHRDSATYAKPENARGEPCAGRIPAGRRMRAIRMPQIRPA